MACLKELGILIALCATLAVSIDVGLESPPEHEQYHGPNNPNYPVQRPSSEEFVPVRDHHSHHKPHFPHDFHGSHGNWEHNNHHDHGSHNPTYGQLFEYQQALERRRPIFYPYVPYHAYPYYPHAYPSNNDEEFETIEARGKEYYHGSHNLNFPVAQDSDESFEQKPFYHGLPNWFPHFPFNFDSSEENSDEEQSRPYFEFHLPHLPHWPNIPFPFHKEPDSEDLNVEGSGDEDIVPLATGAKIPLQEDDDEVEGAEESDPNDVIPVSFRSFLESRKSISVECDALNTPRYSCYNCHNYLVCKPDGGKIKACKDPYAPYCVNGICSATPGPEC